LKQVVVAARHKPDEWLIWMRLTFVRIHHSHRNLPPGFHCQLHYRSPQNIQQSATGESSARFSSTRVEAPETLHPDALVHRPTDTTQRQSDDRPTRGAHDLRQVEHGKSPYEPRPSLAQGAESHPRMHIFPTAQRFASAVSDTRLLLNAVVESLQLAATVSELNHTVSYAR
jgi:hypothetical protein